MRDIALVIIILASLPICFMRPWLGYLVWSWLGFMNPHKLTWGIAQGMPFAMMVGGCVLAGLIVTRDKKAPAWGPEITFITLLAIYYTFTTFFAWAPQEAWVHWNKVTKIAFMACVMTMLFYTKKRIHALLLITALSIGFYGFKGAIFTILGGGVNRVEGPEGTYLDGNTFLGLGLIMALPLLIFLAREEPRKWLRRVLYVVAAFSIISIIFTYSRGALLGLAAVLPLLFLKTKRKFLIILLVLPVVYFGKDFVPTKLYQRAQTLETFDEDRSSMQRIQAWNVAWNVAKDYPLTGAGFEFDYAPDEERWLQYADRKYDRFGEKARAAHSIYFQIIGHHGFVAFGLFITMLALTLINMQRLKGRAKRLPGFEWVGNYANAMQISLIGYLVAGAFLNAAYFDLMYLYVALTAVLRRELSSTEQPAPPVKYGRRVTSGTQARAGSFASPKQFISTAKTENK